MLQKTKEGREVLPSYVLCNLALCYEFYSSSSLSPCAYSFFCLNIKQVAKPTAADKVLGPDTFSRKWSFIPLQNNLFVE